MLTRLMRHARKADGPPGSETQDVLETGGGRPIVERPGSGSRLPGFECHFSCLLAVSLWASDLISPGFSLLTFKIEIIIALT